jgi:mannose-6-phosphate isomerase-like protein (cupin superfamily)
MYEQYVVEAWKERGEIREEPYKREIVPIFGPEFRDVPEFNVNVTYINPFSGTQYHNHVLCELIWVVSGRGELLMEKEKYALGPDTVFYVPKGVFHHIINTSPETMKLINVFAPGMKREDQKKRIVVKEPPAG